MITSCRIRTMSTLATAAVFTAVVPFVVHAAGGGGGGGGGAPTGTGNTVLETCSQDVWSCGEWGTCGLNGQQARECRTTVDCPTTESPAAPPTIRVCTPECTGDAWICGQWGPCSSASVRTRTCAQRTDCKPSDQPTPRPAERAACTPPKPSVAPAPKPVPISPPLSEGEREGVRVQTRDGSDLSRPQLICGNLSTLEERVRCRIGLDDETLERELAVQYLPEECRAFDPAVVRDATAGITLKRQACIDRYRKLRPCWAKPIGPERLACVRGVLGLGGLREERAQCDAKVGGDQERCLVEFRAKAYPYITFRFYDLEERAEGLKELGAPLDLVVKFVAAAEQGKQDFNAARSKAERIAIIRRVQSEWRAFIIALPEAVKTRARTEGVGSSY